MTHSHRWFVWLAASVAWIAGWALFFALQDPRASATYWYAEPLGWLLIAGFPLYFVFLLVLFAVYAFVGPMHVEGFDSLAVGRFNLGVLVPIMVSWVQWFVVLPLLTWYADR
jgi:hypothetical protein